MIDRLVFIGSGRNEAIGVYTGANGSSAKISSQEVDRYLERFTDAELNEIVVEVRVDRNHEYLYIHFQDFTAVYDQRASAAAGVSVWFTLDSGAGEVSQYRARGFTWIYNRWLAGDPTSSLVGEAVETESHHFGNIVEWSFGTTIIFNETRGAVFHAMELTALSGQVALGKDPVIITEYSADGVTWSQPKTARVGKQGDLGHRIQWRRMGRMKSTRIQRFRGTSDAHITIARLDAAIEALVV